ncbi:MAG: glycosyltransferase family 2 protein [Brevefilum sp.]|nr:glycosyltransferase family 2 protein [Brevefilum sp.]
MAMRSYKKFKAIHWNQTSQEVNALAHQPKVSFILPWSLELTSELKATLESIKSLPGDDWEVIISLPEGTENIQLQEINDERIKQTQAAKPDLLSHISGEYVLFCQPGDQFSVSLLTEFYATLGKGSPADITYYDCEYIDQNTDKIMPFFKPTALSPALLLSVNYLSRGFARLEILQRFWDKISIHQNFLITEYDLVLRLYEIGGIFRHIPAILVSQKCLPTSETAGCSRVIETHLTRLGLLDVSSVKQPIGMRFTWKTNTPSLAIIILTKNNHKFLLSLLPALQRQPYQGQFTIHIVDNGSDDPATIAFYQQIQTDPQLTIIPYPKPFNYSEAINLGVAKTESDLVLLMNDDMVPMDEIWLTELSQWAVRPEVGVVGAKLLRKNRTIQHAGIILGLTGFMGHIYLNAPENYTGLFGTVNWYRNYLAMTGACQMVRREVFNEVGGYDEGYQLAFGDVDFCLKVHQKGYQNIYTPFAQSYHYEGSSRGYLTPPQDVLRGYEQMATYLTEEDPFFSPNLTYTRIPKCLLETRSADERQNQIEARKQFYLNS